MDSPECVKTGAPKGLGFGDQSKVEFPHVYNNPGFSNRLNDIGIAMDCTNCGTETPDDLRMCASCATTTSSFQESSGFSASAFTTSPGFVGRQRELAELRDALNGALNSRGRLLMLAGEPGIGKTRIVQELAALAETEGVQVLWGRCYEEQGTPPYWPWVQLIRLFVRENPPEELLQDMGSGAAAIAEIIGEVHEKLPNLDPAPPLESAEQARFRFFDSINLFLKAAALRRPLVLVLDDLHWADQPSLLLLQHLTRELGQDRLLFIATYRDVELSRKHPLAETLGELTRERLFQRVQLRGLSLSEVALFIEATPTAELPSQLAELVFAQTEGNPLFMTEVVRLLAQEDTFGNLSQSTRGNIIQTR